MVSGLIGSVPTTTYGENIGVMAVTKVYSVRVIGGAAVLSIICSFVGKLSMMIQTIPGPVIGGISFLLYGMIGASGLPDADIHRVRNRSFRNLCKYRNRIFNRNGAGMRSCDDPESGLLHIR